MKILSRILLVLAVLMLCFGLLVCVAFQTENAQQTAGVYILSGLLLLWLSRRLSRRARSKNQNQPYGIKPSKEKPHPPVLPTPERYELKYSYQDVDVAGSAHYSQKGVYLGQPVQLVPEPQNPHDPSAVAVQIGGKTRGYLPANKLLQMYHDFERRDGSVRAFVSKTGKSSLQLLLGYYDRRPTEYENLVAAGAKFKKVSLTGSGSAEIQEKLLFLEPGEELYARYDSEKDRYCASDYNGPLGYFPASVSSLLEDDPRIFVSEVKQSPTTDKYSVSAAILLEE